jgi:hypothetical protein
MTEVMLLKERTGKLGLDQKPGFVPIDDEEIGFLPVLGADVVEREGAPAPVVPQ